MTWHTDWIDARKDSKAKFKIAYRNKRGQIEGSKVTGESLAALGMGKGDDLDRYLVFKSDFEANLDRLEKAVARNRYVSRAIDGLTLESILADSRLSGAFGAFVAAKGAGAFWSFITEGYQADPVTAYDRFIKRGADLELNVEADEVDQLRAMNGDPVQLESGGAALLAQLRQGLMYCSGGFGPDMLTKFKRSAAAPVAFGSTGDSGPLRKKVLDTIDSFREQIRGYENRWPGIEPDFCKPLLDALGRIEQALRAS